jgi:hypothetical protein
MSILGYSELIQRIYGIDKKKLERPFVILNRNNTTKKRLKVLQILAKNEPATLGQLLTTTKQPRGGGSYNALKNYFLDLEKEGLLIQNNIGTKTIWKFKEGLNEFKLFIINQ